MENEKPWLVMPSELTASVMQLTAKTYGVAIETVAMYANEYITKFREGPGVFFPWYKGIRDEWEAGQFPFEPYYPHEVFPMLAVCGDWFYFYQAEAEYVPANSE